MADTSSTVLGNTTTITATLLSSRKELLDALVTSGRGAPSHRPHVPIQIYVDANAGNNIVYIWAKAAWSVSLTIATT